jgi:DNA-directed RNA polymerase specialized sigma24 family protein
MAEVTGPSPVTDGAAFVLIAPSRSDEQTFARLVDRYHSSMVRVAHAYVATSEAAEDSVQDAWIGIISGDEARQLLDVSEANQRVLLHRARTRVRAALQDELVETLTSDE